MRRSSYKKKNNPYIIEGIQINKDLLSKYLNKEGEKKLKIINDLSQLRTKTDDELLKILQQMIKTKNYFKYCASLLININPGPNFIYDYLNLKRWISSSSSLYLKNQEKNPHLYSFMQYVYETMVKENKDQVVNLLGPIGSGKTFNLIHIMEYFTNMYGPKSYQTELFEMFHNSIQLVHIFGSIYRENNIESTSCGLLINLGFNQNNIISSFGIDSQIFDFSLPFSENGRSFSIIHAFIKGVNDELRKSCKLPQSDEYLSFFSKFLNKFSEKIRENLSFNDLEIWNRFYSLSKYFKFTTDEVIDIMQCLALILNLNELTITKTQINSNKKKNGDKEEESKKEAKEYFEIQKGKSCRKICTNLNINVEDFLNCLNKFKSLQEAKTFIISFMKQTYYIIFDFILIKIRDHINLYFNHLNKKIGTNNFKKMKKIYFLDFPGEVEDKTLGGFTTNISNECLNMYAASGFYEISEKLIREKIILHKFFPIKSYFAVSTCMEKGGLLEHFTKPFNKENFNSLINNCLSKKNFMNCIKFKEKRDFEENDSKFIYNFSHKKIEYNYESLFLEAKSLLKNEIITKIFSLTQNYVINSTYKDILINKSRDFYSFFSNALCKIFEPIKGIKPFIVFCFHSNYSYKIFFRDRDNKEKQEIKDEKEIKNNQRNNISFKEDEMPRDITLDMVKNSFIFPVLFWNWYGFKEWILIDEFIKEYCLDFEKVKNGIIQINNLDPDRKKFETNNLLDFNQLPKEEVAKCTLTILAKEGDFLIGKEYILMKQGTLHRMRLYLNGMIDTAEEMNKHLKEKILIKKNEEQNNKKNVKRRKSTMIMPSKLEEKMKINLGNLDKRKNNRRYSKENILIIKNEINGNKIDYEKIILPEKKKFIPLEEDISRINLLKEQCIINIISKGKIIKAEEKEKIMKNKSFNLYYLISHREKVLEGLENDIKDDIDLEILNIDTKEKDSINDLSNIKTKLSIDKKNSKSFKVNEYTLNQIIKIQSHIRRIISKNKYIILKYIYSQIILIQKFIRGHLTRIKFKKFLDCLEKIKLIQRIYHKRHTIKIKCATIIQEFWIKRLKLKKLKEKIIAKKRAESKGEYFNMKIESFEEFNQNNYNLEYNLRKIELENDKQKLTNKLRKEKDPKKIVEILLYGSEGRNKLTRAQKYGVNLKIEDKLLKQGEIMKKNRQDLADRYEKKFLENNPYKPTIPKNNEEILGNKYPGSFLKRMEFYKLFKNKNLEEIKKEKILNKIKLEDKKNNLEPKTISQPKKKIYEDYINNAFDRLHNEQLQIEQNKKRRNKLENSNTKSDDNFTLNIKKEKESINDNIESINEQKKKNNAKKRMTLKDILISDNMKKIYRNSSVRNINEDNKIWPRKYENNYLNRFQVNNEINKENKSFKSDEESFSSEKEEEYEKEDEKEEENDNEFFQ